MKNILIIVFMLLAVSCASMFDTLKDTGVVGIAAGTGALLAGPVAGALAGGGAYLLVDDTNNIDFIEKHVVKTVVQKEIINPTAMGFLRKFRLYIFIGIIVLLYTNPKKFIRLGKKLLLKVMPQKPKRIDG